MTDSNSQRASKRINMTAYAFLGFLALLCIINVLINAPLGHSADIEKDGIDVLQLKRHKWYSLSAESYLVDSNLGATHIRSSFLPFVSRQYTYFCITVNPGAENAFRMVIRVMDAKEQELSQGKTVALYGMVSNLTGESLPNDESLPDDQVPFLYLCLNDNGDSVFKRGIVTSVFALAAGVFIWLIVKIATKQ